jgi:hypothetical protein
VKTGKKGENTYDDQSISYFIHEINNGKEKQQQNKKTPNKQYEP